MIVTLYYLASGNGMRVTVVFSVKIQYNGVFFNVTLHVTLGFKKASRLNVMVFLESNGAVTLMG